MSLVVNLSVGRLLSRNEKLTTAKINAVVKSIVIDITGSVGNADLLAGAVTYDKATMGPWFYSAGAFDGNQTYTAVFAPVITAYVDGMVLAFKADTTNPGAVLFDAGAGPLPLLKHAGQEQLDPGDLAQNAIIEVRLNTTLVAGSCWEVLSLPGRPVESQPWQPTSQYVQGSAGVMPAFPIGAQGKFLRGDGTFHDAVAEAVAQINLATAPTLIYPAQQFI